jgi:hypothetical protein
VPAALGNSARQLVLEDFIPARDALADVLGPWLNDRGVIAPDWISADQHRLTLPMDIMVVPWANERVCDLVQDCILDVGLRIQFGQRPGEADGLVVVAALTEALLGVVHLRMPAELVHIELEHQLV